MSVYHLRHDEPVRRRPLNLTFLLILSNGAAFRVGLTCAAGYVATYSI